jgi:peptidyl-prolyl cis-trans isomerase C
LIEIKLLAARAEEAGLDDSPEFQRRMQLLRERSLHSSYIETEIAAGIDEAAMRARYEELLADQPATEEVRARHILVDTEEEAVEIIGLLDAGGNFEELAAERSSDGAAAQGGDLGYFARGRMVGEFEEAAFAMETGAHSAEPVQTQFGFHVIKVEDRRTQEPPAFEQVQPQIQSLMLRERYIETVEGLRSSAEVEISDPALDAAFQALDAEEPAEAAPAETDAETETETTE